MTSKIEISEEVRAGLNRRAAVMKRKLGRRVTFDEVIKDLLVDSNRHPSPDNEVQDS
jgi:hypothetical protein